MPRPKYKITDSDFNYAYKYIKNNCEQVAITPEFHAIKRSRDSEKLTELCEMKFNGETWDKLKSVIRVERKKNKDLEQDQTIKIKQNSFKELKELKKKLEKYLCKQENKKVSLTYSEIIEKTCESFNMMLEIEAVKELGYYKNTDPEKVFEQKNIKLNLWLHVENNSKHVRGKGKTLKYIEDNYLSKFNAIKIDQSDNDYELTINYYDDKDLNDQIYELIRDMNEEADMRNGFIEYDLFEEGTDRTW